ncbi:hypothetical protein T06_6621 [Trichinella sp. T6]|nr:hypothetical protein T06_6621 [Trichinella sp. T6]
MLIKVIHTLFTSRLSNFYVFSKNNVEVYLDSLLVVIQRINRCSHALAY